LTLIPHTATEHAIALFNYREQATRRVLPCDPNWPRVMAESLGTALAGARGETDQEQCAYQAIRLHFWETGRTFPAPWTRAFLPPVKPPEPLPPAAWYRRWWAWLVNYSKSFLKRINDRI
jgi:hypothetical protein